MRLFPSDLADSGDAIEGSVPPRVSRDTATRESVIVMLVQSASIAHSATSLLATGGTNPGLLVVIAAAALLAGVALYLGLRRRDHS
ncbi:hypothetical protein ASF30_20715 [Leifsonia sp. Leaf264]|nr:hypothetical protein ASF30_20715 [Leifsonia sp. Leaf264]